MEDKMAQVAASSAMEAAASAEKKAKMLYRRIQFANAKGDHAMAARLQDELDAHIGSGKAGWITDLAAPSRTDRTDRLINQYFAQERDRKRDRGEEWRTGMSLPAKTERRWLTGADVEHFKDDEGWDKAWDTEAYWKDIYRKWEEEDKLSKDKGPKKKGY